MGTQKSSNGDEFVVHVVATPSGEDVEAVVVSYREGDLYCTRTLSDEGSVGHLGEYLLGPWNDGTGANGEEVPGSVREDLSLLETLKTIFEGLHEDEKERLSETWGESGSWYSVEQRMVNLWLLGAGTYLGFIGLLEYPEVWCLLPFPFTLPTLPTLSHALTRECAQYMMLPVRGLWNVSEGLLRSTVDVIISFLHTWGSSFMPGISQDRARAQVETISGYSTAVLEKLGTVESRIMEKVEDTLKKEGEEQDRLYAIEEEQLATRIQGAAHRLQERLLLHTSECERKVQDQGANGVIQLQLVAQGETRRLEEEYRIWEEKRRSWEEGWRSEQEEWRANITSNIHELVEEAKKDLKTFIEDTIHHATQEALKTVTRDILEVGTRVRMTLEPQAQEEKQTDREGTHGIHGAQERNGEPLKDPPRYTFRFHRRR